MTSPRTAASRGRAGPGTRPAPNRSTAGPSLPVAPASGPPAIQEISPKDLSIQQPLASGGLFTMVCSETNMTCTGIDGQGQPLNWAWMLIGGTQQSAAVQNVSSNSISYIFYPVTANGSTGAGVNYQLQPAPNAGSCRQLGNGNIQISPDSSGRLVLNLNINP